MNSSDSAASKPRVPRSNRGRRATLEGRFWPKVDRSELSPAGCWPWRAHRQRHGYGTIQAGSRSTGDRAPRLAHVVAYELSGGTVPTGLELRHLCGNAWCVNPVHLIPGTHQQNVADTVAMGRTTAGERHPLAKLTEDAIPVIRERFAAGEPAAGIAADFGVSQSRVYQVASGDGWKHVAVAS